MLYHVQEWLLWGAASQYKPVYQGVNAMHTGMTLSSQLVCASCTSA